MKKLLPLLSVLFLIYWGCEEEDTTPTEVTLWGVVYSVDDTESLNLSNQISLAIPNNNHLTGSIPPEIGNLTNLTYLNLGHNKLTGEIPSEIGNLTNLTYLHLGGNELTGEIPSEIWNLTNLTSMMLYNNELTGSIPSEIGNLTDLSYLELQENQLSGEIPSEIGDHNMVYLLLNDNQLSGEIPENICEFTNLDYSNSGIFNISNNQLCPTYPSCIEDYVGEQDTSNCGD